MLDLMLFDIHDEYISARGNRIYIFSIQPPNFSILDEPDKMLYFKQFENIMRSTMDCEFFFFGIDRTVSLTKNRDYLLSLNPLYDKLTEGLLHEIEGAENVDGNTQRSYYYGLSCKQEVEARRFETMLRSMGCACQTADRAELIQIMRSFNLREFVDYDIMIDPDEQPLVYGSKKLVVAPIVKHLMPTTMSFDNSLDMVVQTNFFRKTFVVRNMPQRVDRHNRDMLKRLFQLSNATVMVRMSDMNYSETRALVNKQYINSSAGLFKRKVADVIEAKSDAQNIEDFYRNVQESATEGGAMKRVNIFVETYGKSREELGENVRRVRRVCETSGMTLEDFVLHQEHGFFGVSPIGFDTRGKMLANNIPSDTLGTMYPFSSSFINDAMGMILGFTIDNGVVSLDIWQRTTYRTNSSVAVVGDSGLGKSYLIKKIISQLRLRGSSVWILDSENEYSTPVRKLGGKVINCSSGKFAINPLQIRKFRDANIDDDSDEDDDSIDQVEAFASNQPFFQHLSWLKDFLNVLIPEAPRHQLNALLIIIQDVYNKFGINQDTDLATLSNNQYPVFPDVFLYIEVALDNPQNYPFYKMIERSDLKAILLMLHDICFGSLSPQFSLHTNATDSDFVNLNIQGLMAGDQNNMQAVLFNYQTYIWGKVMERTGEFVLVVDELALYANEDNPVALRYLNQFVRRVRKYSAALIVGTQKVMDCLNPKISQWTSAIFDTPTYKFLFYPGAVDLDIISNKLRLSAGELATISLPERKNCLLKVGKETYHMKVGTLPYEEELFGKGGGL